MSTTLQAAGSDTGPANPSFVESVVRLWLQLASEAPHHVLTSTVKRLPGEGKASIEITASNYLALVQIWEHATCLDITAHRINTTQGELIAAGPCSSEAQTLQHLLVLRSLLLS
jgi:hypothetical protein